MSSEAQNEETEGTQTDKVNTGALGTLVAVGLFAMISICAAVTALVRHDMDAEQSDKDADANQTVIALKASQRGVLNQPAAYVDRGKGLVSLPIETAKQVVLAELVRDPSLATPPQAAAPAAAAPSAAFNDTNPPTTANGAKIPPETGRSVLERKAAGRKPEKANAPQAPGKPAAPVSPPLTPTAASPGALSPGPLKH